MNTVQPIRDCETIQKVKAALLKRGHRDYMLFVIGINTGLRIGDILNLKVKDFAKSHIIIREEKTGKEKRHLINENLRSEVERYTLDMNLDDYLFPSRKGNKPIGRVQAYRILAEVAEQVGLDEIGTHTLRKTYGYHQYKQNKDIVMLQQLFNHAAPSVTLRYIGIQQDDMDDMNRDFFL